MRSGRMIAAVAAVLAGAVVSAPERAPVFGVKAAEASERTRPAHERRRKALPPPRFTHPSPESFTPGFLSKTNNAEYSMIRAAPNPLMSAEFRATPEYEYLYTAGFAHQARPPVARYSYVRDHSYLLRPSLALTAAAAAYAWRDTPLQVLWTTVGALGTASQPGTVAIRREPAGDRGLLQPVPRLGERFAPVERPRGSR